VSGRIVRTLTDERRPAGRQRVVWDGRDEKGHEAPAGIYLFRLTGASGVATRKAVLLR
jgi:flagellar hook assembly protein FlgD